MTVDQSMSPGSAGEARGHRTDLPALRSEWQAVHGELSTVVEAILAQIFATASRQAVEVLARLEREGTDLLGDLETRRAAAQAEMAELAGRLEHLERRVGMAEEERRQALDAAERATAELLVRARGQADEIIGDAEQRATARLAESEEEAARRLADAEARAAQIVEEAHRRAEDLEREIERDAARIVEPAPTPVAEAAVVEDQLRGLAERISRLLQTTSEVTSAEAAGSSATREEATTAQEWDANRPAARAEAPLAPGAPLTTPPPVFPLRGAPEDEWPADPIEMPTSPEPVRAPEPAHASAPYTFEPRPTGAPDAPTADAADLADEGWPERDVVVPLRPRTAEGQAAPGSGAADADMPTEAGDRDPMPPAPESAEREGLGYQVGERGAPGEAAPEPWLAPAGTVDADSDWRPDVSPSARPDVRWDEPIIPNEADREVPAGPNGVSEPARPHEVAAAGLADPVGFAGPDVGAEADADEAPVQTLVFQAVPNFQAALALERALKGLPGVSDVRVADFDERQLTFQVTHDLGTGLTRNVLALRSHNLDLVDSGRDRAEFVFRA